MVASFAQFGNCNGNLCRFDTRIYPESGGQHLQTVPLAVKPGRLSTPHPRRFEDLRALEGDSLLACQPQQTDICRAIVFLKNPGGTTAIIPGLGRTNGLVPVNIGRMLTRVANIFLRNAQSAGKPFAQDEYVLAANLITVQAGTVREAVRLH